MFGLHITGFVLLQHDNCYYSGRGTSHRLTNQDSSPTPRTAARPIPEGMTVLRLVTFLLYPDLDFELTISSESQWYIDFKTIYCPYRNYCQLLTHKSNTFLSNQYVISPIQTNADAMPKNARSHARNSPFPVRNVDFHLIAYMNAWAHPTYHAN